MEMNILLSIVGIFLIGVGLYLNPSVYNVRILMTRWIINILHIFTATFIASIATIYFLAIGLGQIELSEVGVSVMGAAGLVFVCSAYRRV